MLSRQAFTIAIIFVALLAMKSGYAQSQNLLSNPGFEVVGPNGPTTTFSGSGDGGSSAAASWEVFNNSSITTLTELVPGGNYMLHINTGGLNNGLNQGFNFVSPANASVDVYVLSGQVQLSLLGTGGYDNSTVSTSLNTWEHLAFSLPAGSGEIIIYSKSNGANFYVDNASVTTPLSSVPEMSSVLTAALGVLVYLKCRRKLTAI